MQGVIIQRLSGQSLDTFLHDRIFAPPRMTHTGFGVAAEDRIPPRYALDDNLTLKLAADQSAFPVLAGTPPGVQPRYLLSIAGLYATAQDYLRFAQMLANGGTLDGAGILAPSSVALMTSNMLPPCVPMRFLQPFAGVGYGMGVGIVLNPAHADFNGGAIGAGTYYWGAVHGTWFWVDPLNDVIVVGRRKCDDRPPLPSSRHPRHHPRSITYGALTQPQR